MNAAGGPPVSRSTDGKFEYPRQPYQEGAKPPLPPETYKEPPPPGWTDESTTTHTHPQGGDNLETVAMDDEGNEGETSNFKPFENSGGVLQPAVVQDYHHVSGAAARMQTFDHNHGFSEPVQHPYGSGVTMQQFDYGHGSYDYNRQPVPAQDVAPMLPGAQVFDYSTGNNQYGNSYMHRDPTHRDKPELMPQSTGIPDFSSLAGELVSLLNFIFMSGILVIKTYVYIVMVP